VRSCWSKSVSIPGKSGEVMQLLQLRKSILYVKFFGSVCNMRLSCQGSCGLMMDFRRSTIQITLFSYKRFIKKSKSI
jgi:hypothetical protein